MINLIGIILGIRIAIAVNKAAKVIS